MTTRLTVTNHGPYAVEVDLLDMLENGDEQVVPQAPTRIEPSETAEFFVWHGRALHVKEPT